MLGGISAERKATYMRTVGVTVTVRENAVVFVDSMIYGTISNEFEGFLSRASDVPRGPEVVIISNDK